MTFHVSVDPQGVLAFVGLICLLLGAWQFGLFLGNPVWAVENIIQLALPFIVGAIAIKVSA